MLPSTLKNVFLVCRLKKLAKTWKKAVKKTKTRFYILKQLIDTEANYCKDLKIILNDIAKPLLNTNVITEAESMILFPSVAEMLKLSEQFLLKMNLIKDTWDPHHTCIGESISKFSEFFRIYQAYCQNFMEGQQIIKRLTRENKLTVLSEDARRDIESQLSKPIQRPCKYHLLLDQYLKAFSHKTHKDVEKVRQALERFKKVVNENNQSMDKQLKQKQLYDLERRFKNIIVGQMNRVLLSAFSDCHSVDGVALTVYIMSDLVLLAAKDTELTRIRLTHSSRVRCAHDGKYFVNQLQICGQNTSFYIMFLQTYRLKEVYNTIRRIIEEKATDRANRLMLLHRSNSRESGVSFSGDDIRFIGMPQLWAFINVVFVRGKEEPTYSIEFCFLGDIQLRQRVFFKYSDVLEVEGWLRINIPGMRRVQLISSRTPPSLKGSSYRQGTLQIEYRRVIIEQFLNQVLRMPEIGEFSVQFLKRLRLSEKLLKCAFGPIQDNTGLGTACEMCQQHLDSSAVSEIPLDVLESCYSIYSRNSQSFLKILNPSCLFQSITVQQSLKKRPSKQFNSIWKRIDYMLSKTGRFNHAYFNNSQSEGNLTLGVNIPSKGNIEFKITSETTAAELVKLISMELECRLNDYALLYTCQGYQQLLDQDINMAQFCAPSQSSQPTSILPDKLKWLVPQKVNQLIEWGKQLVSQPGGTLKLVKRLYFPVAIEAQSLKQSAPNRCRIFLQSVFEACENGSIPFSKFELQAICAAYEITYSLPEAKDLSAKPWIQQKRWPMPQALRSIQTQSFHEKVQEIRLVIESQTQRDSLGSCKVMNIVCSELFVMLSENNYFAGHIFHVDNYDPNTIPNEPKELAIIITCDHFYVARRMNPGILILVPLKNLQVKITPFSLFVSTTLREYRFDGSRMADIRALLDAYGALRTLEPNEK